MVGRAVPPRVERAYPSRAAAKATGLDPCDFDRSRHELGSGERQPDRGEHRPGVGLRCRLTADRCRCATLTDLLGLEAVPHPRLGDEVPGSSWVGFELAADLGEVDAEVVRLLSYCGPQTSCRSCRWVTSLPAFRTSNSTMCHSVGVRRTSPPGIVTRLAARSTVKCSVSTTASSSAGAVRRNAARRRASSSSMPKGLVT